MRDTDDPMAPEASPGTLTTRSGVRRVNNLPMYLMGGVMIAFLVIMMMVAADRAARQHTPAGEPAGKRAAPRCSPGRSRASRLAGSFPPPLD